MIRRLAELAGDEGTAEEQAFAQRFLESIAYDVTSQGHRHVWDRTWREGQNLWEKAVKLYIDLEHPKPEVEAMWILDALIEAGKTLREMHGHFE